MPLVPLCYISRIPHRSCLFQSALVYNGRGAVSFRIVSRKARERPYLLASSIVSAAVPEAGK